MILVWFGLSQGLRPLNRLRERIETRREADLSPIAAARVPEELQPLTEAFNSMLARMQHNMDAQRRFISDAAHQMRTPLAGLKMQAQLAMRESDPGQLRYALGNISSSVDRSSSFSTCPKCSLRLSPRAWMASVTLLCRKPSTVSGFCPGWR